MLNYLCHNSLGGGVEGKKEEESLLARGEKLLAVFLLVQGRPVCGCWPQQWWRRGGYYNAKETSGGEEKN